MNIRVMNDHVLVLLAPQDRQEHSAGGLILAPALTPPVTCGRAVRIGPKVQDVKPGDLVTFPPSAGTPMPIDGHACLFLRESEIATVVSKEVASV